MDLCGPIWSCMVPYGPVLSPIIRYQVWYCMVPYVALGLSMVPRMVQYGPVWSSRVPIVATGSCLVS